MKWGPQNACICCNGPNHSGYVASLVCMQKLNWSAWTGSWHASMGGYCVMAAGP
jgi:hypothetical protein